MTPLQSSSTLSDTAQTNLIFELKSLPFSESVIIRRGSAVEKTRVGDLIDAQEEIQVQSLDKTSLHLEWQKIGSVDSSGSRSDQLCFSTKCRREITLGPEQLCQTVDADGEWITLEALEIEPGRTLLPVAGYVPGPYVKKWNPSESGMVLLSSRKPWYQLGDLRLTNDFGWLLGRYVAVGSIYDDRTVEFANVHPRIVDRTEEIVKGLGMHPYRGIEKVKVGSVQFAKALKNEFGSRSKDKRLSGWMFCGSKAFREGFIDGYWSSAGTISERYREMVVSTDSLELAADLRTLMAGLGIQSACRPWNYHHKGGSTDRHYIVEVAASGVRQMPKLHHPEKRLRQRNLKRPKKDYLQVAPIPRNLVHGRLRSKCAKGYGGYAFVHREATHPRLRQLIDGDLLWDLVTEVRQVRAQVPFVDLQLEPGFAAVLHTGIII